MINDHDIFEAFTDIDDKFIAAAHPRELTDDPSVFRPEPRKPIWKTLIPVAACAAIFATAGVLGARYLKTRPDTGTSNPNQVSSGVTSEVNSSNPVIAPDLEQITITTTDVQNYFTMQEFPGYEFGAFNSGIILNGYEMNSVDVTLIDGEVLNLFLGDLNGDGARELCATVRRDGVRSVDILDFANSEYYTTRIMSSEQYVLDGHSGELDIIAIEPHYVTKHTPLSLDNEKLALLLSDIRPTEITDTERFGLAEFPELCFAKSGNTVLMGTNTSDSMMKRVLDGDRFFLADINGDGLRELCSYGGDRTYVMAYDIANDKTYSRNGYINAYRVWLEIRDGELVLIANEDPKGEGYTNNYQHEFKTELMSEIAKPEFEEIPLLMDQTFELPDFEGFTFKVDTQYQSFDFDWERGASGEGGVEHVYLADLDGDGRREIIMIARYIGVSGMKICGYMDNGEFGEAYYFENDGISLVPDGVKLICISESGEERSFEFSKSDLKPFFATSYDSIYTGWNHTMNFSEIFPWCANYEIKIYNHTLTVSGINNHPLTVNGVAVESIEFSNSIKDLYTIPDKENDILYLAFTELSTGDVTLVKLTGRGGDVVILRGDYYLVPTNDRLILVTPDNHSNPSGIPEQFDALKYA